jgi:putative OPT family oligopeptide transporter
MCAGGVLSYLVLIPLIKYFGEGLPTPLAPAHKLISAMSPGQIRSEYILYIGAGAVAAGGIISLVQSLPTIWSGLSAGLKDFGATARQGSATAETPRTDREPFNEVCRHRIIVLLAAISLAKPLHMNPLGAVLIVLFGFLFVTVSSRLTGQIGSSSNPISGMTVATLLFTCLVFLLLGWTGSSYYVMALSVGAIVCIAASNGGSTSQDLKTGHLLGATPKYQQLAIMAGCVLSALLLGPVLTKLNESATVYVPVAQVAPAGLSTDVTKLEKTEHLAKPQFKDDQNAYHVWQKTDEEGGPRAVTS